MNSFTTRITAALALVLALLVSSLSPVLAFDAYDSSVNVQNLENTAGTVDLLAYNPGETVIVADDPIAPLGFNAYLGPEKLPLPDGFKGSMIVSADVQVAAISNLSTPGFTAAAAYLAAGQGATTVLLPLLMKNNSGYNTWYAVQNTSADTNATIDILYSDGVQINDQVIQPGASLTFDQKNENHGDNDREVFSAIITSDQPIVAAAIEENASIMFAYTGFTGSGAAKPVFPLINVQPNINFQTGVTILNSGNTATSVTVSYTPETGSGAACTETQDIPARSSKTFALEAFAYNAPHRPGEDCTNAPKFVGSAKVTGNSTDQPLTAIINQLGAANGGAYGSFDPADATNKVVFPVVMAHNSGFWTGFTVTNVGADNTNVTCTYSGSTKTETQNDLAPGQAMIRNQPATFTEKYVGSATCTGSNPAVPLVGIANEVNLEVSNVDRLLVYEGANTNP